MEFVVSSFNKNRYKRKIVFWSKNETIFLGRGSLIIRMIIDHAHIVIEFVGYEFRLNTFEYEKDLEEYSHPGMQEYLGFQLRIR